MDLNIPPSFQGQYWIRLCHVILIRNGKLCLLLFRKVYVLHGEAVLCFLLDGLKCNMKSLLEQVDAASLFLPPPPPPAWDENLLQIWCILYFRTYFPPCMDVYWLLTGCWGATECLRLNKLTECFWLNCSFSSISSPSPFSSSPTLSSCSSSSSRFGEWLWIMEFCRLACNWKM